MGVIGAVSFAPAGQVAGSPIVLKANKHGCIKTPRVAGVKKQADLKRSGGQEEHSGEGRGERAYIQQRGALILSTDPLNK